MTASATLPEAGWYSDPSGRHESRWWDGESWTARAANAGRTSADQLTREFPPPGQDAAGTVSEDETEPQESALSRPGTADIDDASPADAVPADEADGRTADPTPEKGQEPSRAKRASSASRSSAPKWEQNALAALTAALQTFRKPLTDLVKRDANEGDTRLVVTDFLCDALGYDKFNDLTTEYMVRGEFADYGLRIDKQLVAFVEVKRSAQKLNPRHLRQVETYAVKEGVEWCILTNGQVWQVYHVSVAQGQKVETTRVFEVDLLGDEATEVMVSKLFHLHHDALKRSTITALWQKQAAIAPAALVEVLLSEAVIETLRKEVRRGSGYNPDPEDLVATLRTAVIHPSLL